MKNTTRFIIIASDLVDALAYSSDCNCACPISGAAAPAYQLTPRTLLAPHPQQQHIDLTSDYSVAFAPSISRVTVLNRAAQELLKRFQTPCTLGDLANDEQVAAQQLVQLGLLHMAAPPAPPPADELIAWLHVTNACNLRCTYCYVDKNAEAMSPEVAFAAVDKVFQSARSHGYRRVSLKYAGGEASLNLPLVAEMHTYARSQAAAFGIELRGVVLSNGVGLTRHKLQVIKDLDLCLMISLDGPQAFHDAQRPRLGGQGSFNAVIASIERAQALGLTLTISITVTGASVGGLPPLVAWLLERELHFTLNFYRECEPSVRFRELQLEEQRLIDGMRAAYREVERRLPRYSLLGCLLDRANLSVSHQHTCAAGENYLVIDHHGRIAKCQMELASPVTSIWADDPLSVIRLDVRGVQNVPVDQKEGCRDCAWKYWCAGGCAVATYRATGRYDIKSPNCGIYKALYHDVIRLEGLRLLRWADARHSD
ncbi:MAG: radical SAM protein [Chloroflexales bacterium]|nr:radical SAM protein [Chloroflexales bacterium]